MKERPITFSGEMVVAILAGKKTQTRRVVKLQPDPGWRIFEHDGEFIVRDEGGNVAFDHEARCPYSGVDRLWVRERWSTPSFWDSHPPRDLPPHEIPIVYHADGAGATPHFKTGKTRPSIFMPRWASRITLEVKRVLVERVQDITEEDARAEGVEPMIPGQLTAAGIPPHAYAFRCLWMRLNDKRGHGWAANPWVWVVEFERVKA